MICLLDRSSTASAMRCFEFVDAQRRVELGEAIADGSSERPLGEAHAACDGVPVDAELGCRGDQVETGADVGP